jgi:TM2 domain-containing membrane protein YozV
MKTLIISMIIIIIANVNIILSQSNTTTGEINLESEVIGSEKNPALAFGLSLLIPGLGQMYNEQIGTGFAFFFLGELSAGLALFSSDDNTELMGLALYGAIELISVIAATISAKSITDKVRAKKAYLRAKYKSVAEFETDLGTIDIKPATTWHSGLIGIVINF